jgi:YidC/Oxa1 family membrane protein insertase
VRTQGSIAPQLYTEQEVSLAEIRNPNQSGGGGGGKNDSRSMLVVSLVFLLVIFGMQYFKPKKPAPAPQPKQQAAMQQRPAAANGASAAPAASSVAPVTAAAASTTTPTAEAQSESTVTVENELYRIQFTNRGAAVKSWVLKNYKDDDGKPLDLVNATAAAKFGYPLSIFTYDAGLRERLASLLYVPSTTQAITAPGELSFNYAAGGLSVTKTLRFDSSYVVHVETSVTNNGATVPAMIAWPAGFGDQETMAHYANAQFDTSQNGKFNHEAPKKVSGGQTINGPFDYAGISDQYFAAIVLPDAPDLATVVSLNNALTIPRDRKKPEAGMDTVPVLGVAVGSLSGPTAARVFAGPKVINVLNSVHATALNGTQTGPSIEPILNFGWLSPVVKPLFVVLHFFYEHVTFHNWGWAILLLTLIINVAMLPTRVQMMKSALKMQRVQPEMQQIREKYKKYKATDPRRQEMNKEIMALQQREGVNMFGGCLPMLIQYPLLYGFYRMLMNVIELRQAHWGWLHDLAAPDPLHILPIFVIISMFLVQYLSPSPGMDPAQQRMMAFMTPVLFGFFMWTIASGVALYWAAGNIINTVQQLIMNRTGMGKQMREIAEKRAAKKRLGKPAAARR